MLSQRDLKILLWIGYATGYGLAVGGPILIDPQLVSHTVYPSRHYPNAFLCLPIVTLLLLAEAALLMRARRLRALFTSVSLFTGAIVVTFPIFKPELPHGNLFAVGATTTFLSAFTIFVWWMCERMAQDARTIETSGPSAFEYMKTLFTFARQGAFAGVTLFGVLFFAAFTTEFKYVEMSVTAKPDIFLLNLNIALQIAFYATFAVAGPVRYFFEMTLDVLFEFKKLATQADLELSRKVTPAVLLPRPAGANPAEEDEAVAQPVLPPPLRA